jgi:predicted ATPase
MDAAERMDTKLFRPLHLAQLAAAHERAGQSEVGLILLDEAIATTEKTEERMFEAELHRRRGDLLVSVGRTGEGEVAMKEALTVARAQASRMWELRAATSLAEFLRDQLHYDEARSVLTPVFDWFTEGFHLPDLKKAKALLDELG